MASRMADWPDEPVDPFFNVNTPEDAAAAERYCGAAYPDASEPLDPGLRRVSLIMIAKRIASRLSRGGGMP